MKLPWVMISFAVLATAGLVYLKYPRPSANPATERRVLGFIREIREQDGNLVLMFDDAVWLTGREAEDAA